MSGSTMIFRLCDEDEDVDLASEPLRQSATRSPRRQFRSRLSYLVGHSQPPASQPGQPADGGWAGQEPAGSDSLPTTDFTVADDAWDHDPDVTGERGLFDLDEAEPDESQRWLAGEPEHRFDGDARLSPGRRTLGRAFSDAASSGSWSSGRVLALGAIAIVALLVVAIGHSARHAGRGSTGQRPVTVAAASAIPGAPLPAPVQSSPGGRRLTPQPPAALASTPRGPRRPDRRRPRSRTASRPRRQAARVPVPHPPVSAQPPTPTPAPAPVDAVSTPAPEPARAPARRAPVSPSSASSSRPAEFSFER